MTGGSIPEPIERLTRPPTAVGLALALFLLPLLSVSGIVEGAFVGAAIKWIVVGLLLVVVVRFESKPVSSIGMIRPRAVDLGWALVLVVVGIGVFALTNSIVEALGLPTQQGLAYPSLAVGIVSAITAGITEEILFRGYPIERLIDGGFGPIAAGGITWGLFTVAHVGAGYPAGNLVQIGAVALGFTAVYVHVRSLFPVVVGHVLVDLLGVLAYVFG